MSTIVCQGVQPCLDTQVLEKTMLRLTLAAPKSIDFSREKCHFEDIMTTKAITLGTDTHNSSNLDLGGWSFLQSLSNLSPKEEKPKESSYVHPLVKRSSSPRLSEKSLEICTENLGSETGTDTIESTIFSSFSSDSVTETSLPKEEKKLTKQQMGSRKVNSYNFPPPLTSRSGSNSLQFRPHREGGRLIIKAIESPSTHTYFQAERSNGRLRLSFLKDHASNFDLNVTTIEENESISEEDDIDRVENDTEDEEKEEEENDEEEKYELEDDEEEEDDDEEESDVYLRKDMEGNSLDVEVEMGMEKFQRPSRCKEGGRGNKGLCNWEALWVATS
ncbi:unnamed protein product [Ilex paraguariensis]|uniref:FAF domain-containing protein n=1 Tax=Ilex paraguariensis TaxID=185542 RepID=A0ABC8TWT7_9AQUA